MHYNKNWTFLTKEEFEKIKDSYELKNEQKEQNRRLWLYGWQKLPNKIIHWKEVGKLISIPSGLRGYYNFTDEYGVVNNVTHPEILNEYKWNELDLQQDKLIKSLLEKEVAFWLISTGAGKTMISAKIIKEKSVKTLIVVSGIELMNQMKNDLEEIFWEKYPTIHWTTWIVKQILIPEDSLENDILDTMNLIKATVSVFQIKRLKKRLKLLKDKRKFTEEINYKKLEKIMKSNIIIANIDTLVTLPRKDFFEKFDLTIMDEVDCYLWADRRRKMIWEKVNSKYIYWITGTIKINYTPDKIFPMYLWKKSELIIKHFQPDIFKVMTDFTYVLEDMKLYHELKATIYTDENRNDLIVNTVIKTIWNNKWIIFSEYIDHAKVLKEKLEDKWIKCFMLIGEVKSKERLEIKKQLKEYKWTCILIGSVKIIWRGFNVPELSVWYLTTTEKFKSSIEQYVWRIIRVFPWKTKATWYDFIDPWCRTLLNQSKARNTTYKKEFPKSNIYFYNN